MLGRNEKKDNNPSSYLDAIELVGPREYNISIQAEEPLHFYTLGCQGEEGARQRSVASIMNTSAKEKKPHFMLFLGDNFYPKLWQSTLTSPTDPKFNNIYHHVYTDEHLSDLPGIFVLGNHDANLERVAQTGNKFFNVFSQGKEVEKHQVAHTYTQKTPEFFMQDNLDIKQMPKWNMPYYYCAYRFESQKTSLFCLNSNTYVADFIKFWLNSETNQATWFDAAFHSANHQTHNRLVAMHNPLLTSSKRARPDRYDADLYLSERQIQQMNYLIRRLNDADFKQTDIPENVKKIFTRSDPNINEQVDREDKNGSYANMLAACFKVQGIKPDAVFCAHDHALVYNRTDNLCQVISGAGGSTNLMAKETNANDASMGCYVTEPGFVGVTCHPDRKLEFTYRDVKGHELKFDNTKHLPISSNLPDATPAAAYGDNDRPSVASAARMS